LYLLQSQISIHTIMVSEEGLREFEEQMDKLGVLEDMKSQYVKMEELRREVKAENKKKAKEEGGRAEL